MIFTLYASRTDTSIRTKDFGTFKDCFHGILEEDWYDSDTVDNIVFSNGEIRFQVAIGEEQEDTERCFFIGEDSYSLYDALDLITNRLF